MGGAPRTRGAYIPTKNVGTYAPPAGDAALARSRTSADLCAFCTAAVWFENNFRVALAHNHLIRCAPLSGSVSLDPDFSLRHVNRAGGPDLDRVQPRVLRVVGCQRHVLPELKDRRPFFRNRHAVGS